MCPASYVKDPGVDSHCPHNHWDCKWHSTVTLLLNCGLGCEFAHRFFEQIPCFLSAKKQKCDLLVFLSESHFRSFLKSDGSESLIFLFKKKRMSEERCEQFALGHKKRGKHTKIRFILANHSFLREICLNHKRITHIPLFYKEGRERFAHVTLL